MTLWERGYEVEPIQLEFIQWDAHWIWNRSRMGLLKSENEDVTNITSESSNPYTSLKFQRTRWKRSSSWTWTMSPPFTSSDTTCNQHFSLLPLPRRHMLTQCILQHHQICNLLAEPVENERVDWWERGSSLDSLDAMVSNTNSLFQTEVTPNASRCLDFTLMKPSTSPILPMRSSEILHSNTNATTRVS